MARPKISSKYLSAQILFFLQVALVCNLQPLPACAVYGFSLPFFYILAITLFFIPCILMTAYLSKKKTIAGGSYIWVEEAFNKQIGFFASCIFWISNLLWYPSIFTFIATNFAYLFSPNLSENKIFIMSFTILIFWGITVLNIRGIQPSTKFSAWCCLIGIIFPILVIIILGIIWLISGNPIQINLKTTPLIPKFNSFESFGFLIAVIISMFGIELTSVHASNVYEPRKSFPKSLILSGIFITIILICASTAIALVIPREKLSTLSGLLDAIQVFFSNIGGKWILKLILLLIFIGNLGSTATWMLGATRMMYVASKNNNMHPFLQKTNINESPVGILILEAVIVTLAWLLFLVFPKINSTYWTLLVLASQISLIYYTLLFISAFLLKKREITPNKKSKYSFLCLMLLGIMSSFTTMLLGFVAPSNIAYHETVLFHWILAIGLVLTLTIPFILLSLKTNNFNSEEFYLESTKSIEERK